MNSKHPLAALCVALAASMSLTSAQDTPPPPPPPPAEGAAEAPPPAEPSPTAIALQHAKDAFKTGAWQEALDAAQKVLEAQPKDLESLYIAGYSERQLNRFGDAEKHLRLLVEASPNFPLSHFQLGYLVFQRAEGLTRDGQVEPAKSKYLEAAEEFGKEIARDPTHVASLSSRAVALARAGKLEESALAYEAWISAVPQKNGPIISFAAAYAGAGRSTDAMNTLERLPDKTQKSVLDAMFVTAAVFGARRDWSAAVPFLEKAVATDTTSAHALSLLTEACARAGLANDTARNLQTLLTMDPTADEAESVGEAIKAVMGDGVSARPPATGTESPVVVRLPSPKYPKGQDATVQTEVLVLALVRADGTIGNTVMVPNRIWKDIRASGFEAAAFDAVRRGKYTAGKKGETPADLWIVVSVKFTHL